VTVLTSAGVPNAAETTHVGIVLGVWLTTTMIGAGVGGLLGRMLFGDLVAMLLLCLLGGVIGFGMGVILATWDNHYTHGRLGRCVLIYASGYGFIGALFTNLPGCGLLERTVIIVCCAAAVVAAILTVHRRSGTKRRGA
jgi:hypothetical protein